MAERSRITVTDETGVELDVNDLEIELAGYGCQIVVAPADDVCEYTYAFPRHFLTPGFRRVALFDAATQRELESVEVPAGRTIGAVAGLMQRLREGHFDAD